MEVFYDTIVIGAGASGLMAAIAASKDNNNVCILEHMKDAAKKLLITGNGRCNLTNLNMDKAFYGRECADFAINIIKKFNEKDTIRFFRKLGMLVHDRNGYVYPYTDQAATVRNVLLTRIKQLGITLKTQVNITDIKKNDTCFTLHTDSGDFKCHNLIMATGSKAYKNTGSDGSGYKLAAKLGHSIVKPLPSLTALTCDKNELCAAEGVRCHCRVTLFVDGKECAQDTGEVQLTAFGISGIPVFQISRYAVRAVDNKQNVFASLDFLPEYSLDELKEIADLQINKNNASNNSAVLSDVLIGILNSKLLNAVALRAGLVLEKKLVRIDAGDIYDLLYLIKNYRLNVNGFKSFDFAQVCRGGVALDEISGETLCSLKVPGLYFAGEIINVDGLCGGYNLQWAFSSGYIAGSACSAKGSL